MTIELTAVEAVIVKTALKTRIELYKKTGLTSEDMDGKELQSVINKIEEAFKKHYERVV